MCTNKLGWWFQLCVELARGTIVLEVMFNDQDLKENHFDLCFICQREV